jgi:hypothetical protein
MNLFSWSLPCCFYLLSSIFFFLVLWVISKKGQLVRYTDRGWLKWSRSWRSIDLSDSCVSNWLFKVFQFLINSLIRIAEIWTVIRTWDRTSITVISSHNWDDYSLDPSTIMVDNEILCTKNLSIDWKYKNQSNLNDRYRSLILELGDSYELGEITRVRHWITSIRIQSYKIKHEIRRIEARTRLNFSRIHLVPNSGTNWYLGTIAPVIHHPDEQSESID